MRPTGPIPAEVMIVGEAPGEQEERAGLPFVGPSGKLLDATLQSVGFLRTSCFVTNVCRVKPPANPKTKNPNDITLWFSDNVHAPKVGEWVRLGNKWVHPHVRDGYNLLMAEIALVKPKMIIALGGVALWALTSREGITKWQGSRLYLAPHAGPTTTLVVPAIHPAAVLRQGSQGPALQMAFKRAYNIFTGAQKPREYSFTIQPTFGAVSSALYSILGKADTALRSGSTYLLSGDIETRSKMITCLGFADNPTSAICIPFLTASTTTPFYWSVEEEVQIVSLLRRIFSHPAILHIGQNYLYDCQYYGRHWLTRPTQVFDTMIGHHALFSSMLKGLDFLSFMYAQDHIYWKDESKDWDPSIGEKQLWTYNCKDACITYEVSSAIHAMRGDIGLGAHFEFQQSLFFPVLRMMNRGVRWDLEKRKVLRSELVKAGDRRRALIHQMTKEDLYGPKGISSTKVMEFMYEVMQIPGAKSLKTGNPTADSDALEYIATREPLLRPLAVAINEARSITTFMGTFIEAGVDDDGRMRSAFNVAGPVTYRFSSNENAFGSGFNFQNVPTDKTGKKKVRGSWIGEALPNVRALAIPDEGFTFFDGDLDRADLQVVVWEAEDSDLKIALKAGIDLHCFNACDIFDIKGIPRDELVETHPNYADHRKRIGAVYRNRAKQGVHAVDYGIGARKLAITLGITIHEAERFISRWLGIHPGIRKWHRRTEEQAARLGYIENLFGARLYQFGHFDLPEALGWLPQSTVAGVINRILLLVDAEVEAGRSPIQLLLQVHDSLAGQFPTESKDQSIHTLQTCAQRVVVPYADPLIIPFGIKTSEISWGMVK